MNIFIFLSIYLSTCIPFSIFILISKCILLSIYLYIILSIYLSRNNIFISYLLIYFLNQSNHIYCSSISLSVSIGPISPLSSACLQGNCQFVQPIFIICAFLLLFSWGLKDFLAGFFPYFSSALFVVWFSTELYDGRRCMYTLHAGQQTSSRAMGKVMRGVTKGGQNNNNHTTNHIANCLVVLAIWEDALVIVVCYTWVLAAFSFLLSAALIEYYFWHVLRLAAFCVVPWPKIKADIIQKQTKHQMSTMNLESSLEFCTRGRRRSVRGWKGAPSTSPARETQQTFCVCD